MRVHCGAFLSCSPAQNQAYNTSMKNKHVLIYFIYINVTKTEYKKEGGAAALDGLFFRATSHGSQQQWFRFDLKQKSP